MTYTRRDFGKLALAASGSALFGGPDTLLAAQQAPRPNSKFKGVEIGTISYSYRSMPDQSAEATLRYIVASGISAVELMGAPVTAYARARSGFTPSTGGNAARGGGRGGGGAEAAARPRRLRRPARRRRRVDGFVEWTDVRPTHPGRRWRQRSRTGRWPRRGAADARTGGGSRGATQVAPIAVDGHLQGPSEDVQRRRRQHLRGEEHSARACPMKSWSSYSRSTKRLAPPIPRWSCPAAPTPPPRSSVLATGVQEADLRCVP